MKEYALRKVESNTLTTPSNSQEHSSSNTHSFKYTVRTLSLLHGDWMTWLQNYLIFNDTQKTTCHIASYVVGSSNETDIVQFVDTEANIATEVSLTILDLLCLYTLNHQVCFAASFSVWNGAMWDMWWREGLGDQAHRKLKVLETVR